MSAEALLRGVLEAPDDDAPRLVYADWLTENGEPERGEAIRHGIAVPNVIFQHPAINFAGTWFMRRGFDEAVAISIPDWFAHAPAILAAHPVRTVHLTSRAWVPESKGWEKQVDEAYLAKRWPSITFHLHEPLTPMHRNVGTEAEPEWVPYG